MTERRLPIYAVDTLDGNELTSGLQDHVARETAQRIANRRGEAVTLYAITEIEHSERIEPEIAEVCKIHKLKISARNIDGLCVGFAVRGSSIIATETYPKDYRYSARQEALRLAFEAGWCRRY